MTTATLHQGISAVAASFCRRHANWRSRPYLSSSAHRPPMPLRPARSRANRTARPALRFPTVAGPASSALRLISHRKHVQLVPASPATGTAAVSRPARQPWTHALLRRERSDGDPDVSIASYAWDFVTGRQVRARRQRTVRPESLQGDARCRRIASTVAANWRTSRLSPASLSAWLRSANTSTRPS